MNSSAISTSEIEDAHSGSYYIPSRSPDCCSSDSGAVDPTIFFFFFFWEKAEGTLLGHWSVGIVAPGPVGLQLSTFLIPQCPDLLFGRLC